MSIRFVVALITFQVFFSLSDAYCDELDVACPNTYNAYGYCCNYYDGYYHNCCYSLYVWALWYFWFGIVMFFLLCGAVVGCCKKCAAKSQRNKTTTHYNAEEGQVTTTTQVVIPVQQPMPAVVVPDVPPTYQQVEQQGINAQYKEFSGYGTPVIPSIPPGAEVTPVSTNQPPSP